MVRNRFSFHASVAIQLTPDRCRMHNIRDTAALYDDARIPADNRVRRYAVSYESTTRDAAAATDCYPSHNDRVRTNPNFVFQNRTLSHSLGA